MGTESSPISRTPPAAVPLRDVSHLLPHVHVRQTGEWDCGVACATAVISLLLSSAGELVDVAAVYQRCAAKTTADGTWTIELALMLRHELQLSTFPILKSVVPRFHSQVLGVDPAHAELSFYSSVLERDAPRIQKLFAEAASAGIPLHQHHVPLDRICDALSRRESLFIVLVDVRPLQCARCTLGAGHFRWSYSGHYILLTGYSYEADAFTYMDPAVGHGVSSDAALPTAVDSISGSGAAGAAATGSHCAPAATAAAASAAAPSGSRLDSPTGADSAAATPAAAGASSGGVGAAFSSFLRYVAGSIGLASSSSSGSSADSASAAVAATSNSAFYRPVSGAGSPHCVIRAKDLEAARTARGTDEDIIEVPLPAARAIDDAGAAAAGSSSGADATESSEDEGATATDARTAARAAGKSAAQGGVTSAAPAAP